MGVKTELQKGVKYRMAKIKTSILIEEKVWKEIKKAAIDAGKNTGEYIAKLFIDRKGG